ncbi:hypothetical protein INT45_007612 [Circinella minor]|uniref:Putative zinc-finger domain-containing protein n=1 Tax=Circinella minor TaxID=1195481 RepID=A0A8H7RXU8_9FUNG|nr:hypothetical protein INT45_007612 [Circinella minor]
MASPQSSVDMDISDGSDLDQASHSSDMEVSNNSDDEIAYNTSNNNVVHTNVSHAEQMRIPPSNHYYYKPSSSYPRVYEVTNQNTASLYTQDVPPNVENYYTTQAPVVTEGYPYYNYQQPINVSSSALHHHEQQSMYYNSVNQTSLPMDSTIGTTHQSNVIEAFAAVAIEDQDKKQEDQVMKDDDDDTDSLSSYVTAPLYTVNESEEEGLIGDEDEDDMETLGWYKHIVHKLDTEIDKTKKSKRALEEEVLRLQIKLSVEKNKINSIMKKKNDKKKKMMDKGNKKMKSIVSTSIVPEEQPVTKKNSSASPAVTSFSYKSTSSNMAPKQPPTSTPLTSNLSSSTLQKPVETTKTTISKPASPLTIASPSLPLPSASGIVKTNKPIKSKDTPSSSSSSSISTPVSNPMIKKSTVSTPPSTGSTIPSTMPSKVSTSIISSKPSSSPTSFNKPNTLTNLKKTSSTMTPPTRVNAITQRKSSSIHPAPKNGIQHHSKGAFKPYESPLRRFGFSHMDTKENGIKNNDKNMMSSGIIISSNGVSNNHSNNNNDVDNGNSGDMNRALCRYETVGGTCNDDTCQALHFRDFQ